MRSTEQDPAAPRIAGFSMRLRLAAVLLAAIAGCGAAAAADRIDCEAINRGALDVEFGTTAVATRQVVLKAGETLDFSFQTVAGPFGSLTLTSGAGAPRGLLVGPSGTTVRFVAPLRGAFGFQFTTESEADAVFKVTCAPVGSSRQKEGPSAATARRAMRLLASSQSARAVEAPEAGNETEASSPLPAEAVTQAAAPAPPRVEKGTRQAAAIPPSPIDVWLQQKDVKYSINKPVAAAGNIDPGGLSAGGLNYKVLPGIMIGAQVQFDQASEQVIGEPRTLSEQGWVVGPMAKVQLGPSLSLDARAAWGEDPSGALYPAFGEFIGERRLVNARLANVQVFGPWRFSPSVAVDYSEEIQHAMAPPASGLPGTRTPVGSGRVDIRPELGYRINLDGSTFVEPKAAVSSFWDIDSLGRLAPAAGSREDLRLKAEAGVTVGDADGSQIQASGAVEEGAAGAADVWSGKFQLKVPIK